jgi:hypothetical protein
MVHPLAHQHPQVGPVQVRQCRRLSIRFQHHAAPLPTRHAPCATPRTVPLTSGLAARLAPRATGACALLPDPARPGQCALADPAAAAPLSLSPLLPLPFLPLRGSLRFSLAFRHRASYGGFVASTLLHLVSLCKRKK